MPSAFVLLSLALSAPPLNTPVQAVLRLRAAKSPSAMTAAVKEVAAACRGRLRHTLRDDPRLLAEVKRRSNDSDPGMRRAVLDLDRCFTPQRFAKILAPRFSDEAPEVIAYAAEVAARGEDPRLAPPLLAALEARQAECQKPGLAQPWIEGCVWLVYAPGAVIKRADRALKDAAATRAVALFDSPYPKVREVAVETVAASGLKKYAAAVADLVAREKKGAFKSPNRPELVARFEARRRALARGQ